MNSTCKQNDVYDVIGVGVGPFNLGLAALADSVPEIDALFFERNDSFNWHPGLLIEGTTLQVPFLADLVSMADVTSKYSFLNYLQKHNRLYSFYFLENFKIPRAEYNHYCQWVAESLDSCRFGMNVESIALVETVNGAVYEVRVADQTNGAESVYFSRHIALGIGTGPHVPEPLRDALGGEVFHSSDYLMKKRDGFKGKTVAVVGSGQSAAEIFYDLAAGGCARHVSWLTRSKGFFPMEYSNLGLEYFSPDYIDFFYQLPQWKKDELLREQDLLYKGISAKTISDIYHLLYERTAAGRAAAFDLQSMTEVKRIERAAGSFILHCSHRVNEERFERRADAVILATGYKERMPEFLAPINGLIEKDDSGRFAVTRDYRLKTTAKTDSRIFVQNGELHTHGVGAPDLGLGAYRNSVIINQLAGREVYPVSHKTVFQTFGTGSKEKAAVPNG
ncbi:lysine 6-monooxygenase [Bacillus glycinifermentans]|uniref:L-lysine N6-monooxygenase MbtG n=1 Tax=Bacillus glycinifermentans TaxID=1664069 RepID=A0A0J6EJY4_9BACI|nr:lysine N(6)-hydroxylase/L-ornithine N(5)-oxygenase family protein [Bacillus glycinifermentans]KMM57883.1 lysine 6-monooxygenase [Bacillus glycinifermentans]KRT93214.1 lysine 6-monooxygenase [Bacillus glycinifermentans]MEC0487607.1 lysine N(6)-hydroxylase/L-ornithine N(5)-oxygenase family protein [Bacillus glycinifermentans]MEC0495788.1 lysine N(6)-hydroxylase/L-ornithine N(5)-oxygenase family protein [Bacillus glycinifermentans]MEC0542732.1 lysine N(6)-hydroxylase/L-ornithine N(5)-oxygenase